MNAVVSLYAALLDLYAHDGVEPVLDGLLPPIVAATGARQAYVELHDEAGQLRYWRAWDCDDGDVERIRVALSRGIVAAAISSGTVVRTHSAILDPAFAARDSVRHHQIEDVICAPVGNPPRGVLYLQGPTRSFGSEDQELVQDVARRLGPLVAHVLARADRDSDSTARWRARLDCDDMVGRSPAIADTLEAVAMVAPLDLPVLLTGPSGTGKSLLARVIHRNSPRRDRPFVTVDCPSLPEALFERELFGAEAGAYTGASARTHGLIAEAEGGTLLLEEVGDLAPAHQAKLLTFLETRSYRRLGSPREHGADVRIVAATNRDLETDLSFRSDLYYRLATFPIALPSLSERKGDVPALARALLDRFAREQRMPPVPLSPGAVRELTARDWPGNTRDLYNVVRRGLVRASSQKAGQVAAHHLFPELASGASESPTWQDQTRSFHRAMLKRTLDENGWNVADAARTLDLARSRIYELISAFELRRPDERPE